MRRPKHQTTNRSLARARTNKRERTHRLSSPLRHLSRPLSLDRPAIICYVRDSKLTAILAFCHSYALPGRVLTPGHTNCDQHDPCRKTISRCDNCDCFRWSLRFHQWTVAVAILFDYTRSYTLKVAFNCSGIQYFIPLTLALAINSISVGVCSCKYSQLKLYGWKHFSLDGITERYDNCLQ